MPKTVDQAKLSARHAAMLEYQKKIAPFTPTLRELVELWGMRSTDNAARVIERLERDGRAVSRVHGKTKSYYAISPDESIRIKPSEWTPSDVSFEEMIIRANNARAPNTFA